MTQRCRFLLSAVCVVIVLCVAIVRPSSAQAERPTPAFDRAEFVQRARASTERYKRLENAVGAGFRRVGPDMPNMGEHWIQIRRVMQPSIDLDRPSTLTYVRIDGDPVLTGVAYTIPVQAGESVPPVPVEGVEWHFHAGTIHEELMGHRHPTSGSRLGMLHAWIWTDNPDGMFSADNWGLSFIRLGLPVPADVNPDAAKALFLLGGGVDYYATLITASSYAAEADVREHLEGYRSRVAQLVEAGAPSVTELSVLWQEMWSNVEWDIK